MSAAVGEWRPAEAVPTGGAAYVDTDWVPVTGAGVLTIPAVLHAPDRGVRWPAGEWIALPEGQNADEAVVSMLAAMAEPVIAALPPDGPVLVQGRGVVATHVREALGPRASLDPVPPPPAAVDTTGTGTGIAEALGAVADMGLVVLAAGSSGVTLDLYKDAHKRGVRMLGIPDPSAFHGSGSTTSGGWLVKRG